MTPCCHECCKGQLDEVFGWPVSVVNPPKCAECGEGKCEKALDHRNRCGSEKA